MLVYTFSTFPHIQKLEEGFGDVFIFQKLKKDLEDFKELVLKKRPDCILGVAKSRGTKSRFEKYALNRFHGDKKIIKRGEERLEMYIPKFVPSSFLISFKPTDTFCNWTMYRISKWLETNHIETKLVFIHVLAKDMDEVLKLLQNSI